MSCPIKNGELGGGNLLSFSRLQSARIVREKVGLKNDGDTKKEFGINIRALENIIDIAAVAVDFAGEPCYGPLLAA